MIDKGFKFIDLFCGIGGFHQAMSSFGGECVFASDIDKENQKTYYDNYGVEVIGDITKVEAKDIPAHDVLCAGFPCQSFSIAGNRQGFEDSTKGTLFFDVIRIAKYHKPKYMLLENVKNLASHDNGNTWKIIYKTLNDIGYHVQEQPVIFSPHFIGIPQNRERVFIMCVRKEFDRIPDFIFEPDKSTLPQCNINTILQNDSEIENLDDYKINEATEELLEHWNKFVQHFKCDMPGCAIYAEYLNDKHLSENGVPEYIIVYKKNCEEFYHRDKEFIDKWLEDGKDIEMFKNSRLHMEWQTNRSEDETIWNNLIQLRQSGIRVKRPTFFPTLVAIVQTSIVGPKKRYLTPRECARLQSFPDSFKLHQKDSIAYRQFGNSVNVEVVKLFAKFMFGDKETRDKYTVNQLF